MSAIGLEIGGTWMRAVALSPEGLVGRCVRVATPEDPAEAGPLLASLWKQLGSLRTVGLATSPELDTAGRVIRWPSRPGYVGTDLLTPLTQEGASPLRLDDASAAALAEHLGASEASCTPSSTVFISAGTGVGAGAVLADRLWNGTTGNAMDLGHSPVPSARGITCSCGSTGCLQAVASGRRLQERAREEGLGADVLTQAAAGEPRATGLLSELVQPLAEGVLLLERLIAPDRIILGGGLLETDLLAQAITERARELGCVLPILHGRWKTWAGALGAAAETLRSKGLRLTRLLEHVEMPAYRIALIQGPNLNLLGEREPEYYGHITLEETEDRLTRLAREMSCHLYCVQSNHEAALVDWIHERRGRLDGAVVNPAALTAHGYALREALTGCRVPFIEVHLSNVDARGGWHRESCFSEVALGRVSGMKTSGYELALRGLVQHLARQETLHGP